MTTCLETYATLRIFSESLAPDVIGDVLGVEATVAKPIDPASRYRPRRETNFWGWCSEGSVNSVDNLQHVAAIIDLLDGKAAALEDLRSRGCQIDICCYWVSTGQGGPSMDMATMKALVALGLEIWWDVYFGKEEEYRPPGD